MLIAIAKKVHHCHLVIKVSLGKAICKSFSRMMQIVKKLVFFIQAAAHVHRFLSLDEDVLRMSADASEGKLNK